MKETKFDLLMKVYKELSEEFRYIDNDIIHKLMSSWSISFKKLDELMATNKVKKSQVTSGLAQGLRDLPDILSDLPEAHREVALNKYKLVLKEIAPDIIKNAHNK